MTLYPASNSSTTNPHDYITKLANIEHFITKYNIDNHKIIPLTSDCSFRKYYRVFTKNSTFILMDSSLELHSLQPFVTINNFLIQQKFSAPLIHQQDLKNGFLLLEDFGNHSYTNYLKLNPHQEKALYNNAIEVLLRLYNNEKEISLPFYDASIYNQKLQIFIDWFLDYKLEPDVFKIATEELLQIFNKLYPTLELLKPTMGLADYMADNLMYLEDRAHYQSVGLLDFQDAIIANPAYDLVSLLQDARRDITPETSHYSYQKFLQSTAIDPDIFNLCYTILSLHNNLRIIGVFHRKNIRDHSPQYLDYTPRVWGYIKNSLNHPQMHELKQWFSRYDIASKDEYY